MANSDAKSFKKVSNDDRVQVKPMVSPPYKWICCLSIESVKGNKYFGTGFKILLPNVNRTAVVTSASCTFVDEEYAKKITVEFPGEKAIKVRSDDLYAPPEYVSSGDENHDYGIILLPGPGDCNEGFGWSSIISKRHLDDRLVNSCGYPNDKPHGTMWFTGGNVVNYSAEMLFYMQDMTSNDSGSPVFTWYNGYWTVLGIHSTCRNNLNSAVRFTSQMIFRFLQSMFGLKSKTICSVAFPGVYLRGHGDGVKSHLAEGGGTINCQYQPPLNWEKFYIYPVEMSPSLALENACKVVIESLTWPNAFVRLDGRKMNKFEDGGGGVVNFQHYAKSWEVFLLKEWSAGIYSFRSAKFPHCYIRMDGGKVDSWLGDGSGTINCQYYDDISKQPHEWETFRLEEC